MQPVLAAVFAGAVLAAGVVLADPGAGAIHDRIAARGRATPAAHENVYGTVDLMVFTRQDSRHFARPARRKVVVVTMSAMGDVAGFVLKRSGVPVCGFVGAYDGECLTLMGCMSGVSC